MKKLSLLFFSALLFAGAQAQVCLRDSSLLTTGGQVSPAPYTDTNPINNIAPGCIGQPYEQSMTLNVPATFSGLPLDSVSIATTGAVTVIPGGTIPAGLSYKCDPPSCVFKKASLGCVILYGTPTAANAVGRVELGIKAKVFSLVSLDVEFPGISPGSHYYLDFYAPGTCPVSTNELQGTIGGIKNVPNPFSDQTEIQVQSLVNGEFAFNVFDLLGKNIYTDRVILFEGTNKFTFDAANLANGTYFYSISNPQGKITKMMVVAK